MPQLSLLERTLLERNAELVDEIAALRAELAEARDLLRWRRTADELPPDGDVLVFGEGWWSVMKADEVAYELADPDAEVTLWWRPLGPLPDDQKEE